MNISLEKYKGRATRHECPGCKDKSSFSLYIDNEKGMPIDKNVGKCNHESGCGYHYTPKQYFIDNPTKRTGLKDWTPTSPKKAEPVRPMGIINFNLVEKSISYQSNFVRFLSDIFDYSSTLNPIIVRLCQLYAIGATKAKEVVFWQIDILGKVRTGKIMQYNPETGKRQWIDWIHNRMIKQKLLSSDFNLKQCFFGEHLLRLNSSSTVAIVESEKTAIIASAFMPDYIWIAAGQLQGLNIDKCSVLVGRKVILFPDLSEKKEKQKTAFELWSEKATQIMKTYACKVIVSDLLEKNATSEERANKLDIADYIINQLRGKTLNSEIKKRFSPQLQNLINKNQSLLLLIEKLELEEHDTFSE